MCSTRKARMGTMPEREWSLCQRKEWPWPARRGWTPRSGGAAGGAGGVAVAMGAPSNHDQCTGGRKIVQARRLFRPRLISVKESEVVCAVIVNFVRFNHVRLFDRDSPMRSIQPLRPKSLLESPKKRKPTANSRAPLH